MRKSTAEIGLYIMMFIGYFFIWTVFATVLLVGNCSLYAALVDSNVDIDLCKSFVILGLCLGLAFKDLERKK